MPGQRGFTLVEMLVALSVASLLVGLVYGAIRVGQRSVSAMASQVEQSEVMRIGWQFLHDALTRAQPVSNREDDEDRTSFSGSTKVLTFVADTPAYVGLGGLMRITLGIDETSDNDQLVLTRQRYDTSTEPVVDQPVERAVLVEHLKRLEISYFGQAEDDETADWHEEWHGLATLPNLVRIDIEPANANAWPTLVASPSRGSAPLDAEDAQQIIGGPPDEAQAEDPDEQPRDDP